jgi:hypothetical protein
VLLPRDDGRYAITLESREFVGGPRRIEINVDLIDVAKPSAKNTVTLVGAMTEAAAAFAQGETDHWKEAARRYESAAALAHKVDRVDLEAEIWFALANLRYLNLTDWNGAVEAAEHAKGAYRDQGNISGYAASLHVEGAALSELMNEQPKAASPEEDTTQAGAYGKEAHQRFEQAATIYSRLGRSLPSVACGNSSACPALMSSIVGNSAAGRVARENLLRPDFTPSFSPLWLICSCAPSGSALQISSSFRPGTVTSPAPWTSTSAVATSSTSRSVAVIDNLSFFATNNTFARIGIVCRLSTTPITACRGFKRASRVATSFIDNTCKNILDNFLYYYY